MKHLIVLVLALLLSACISAPTPPTSPGARTPATAPGTVAPAESRTTTQPPAISGTPAPEPAPPLSSAATDALVLASNSATSAGDHRSAIAHLERAIRIDSRNADLWARLSTSYLRDGRQNLARQYAQRALALAGTRLDWKRSAWLALAAVEEASGNQSEADRIRALYPSARG
jgi:tetratricopeptide (TPR) repeat protein